MEERRNAIVELVNRESSVTFAQIREHFPEVSEVTLRADLKALDKAHRIVRVYGGARSIEFAVGGDGQPRARMGRNAAAKQAIARKAAALIRPNTTIYLDSGSTCAHLAASLPDVRLIVFTPGVINMMELARYDNLRVIVPGGTLNRYNLALEGSRAVDYVGGLTFDQVFLGTAGYSPEVGFTCGNDEGAALKRAAIAQTEERIVLMDSTKVGSRTTFSMCDLSDVDTVISDDDPSADFARRCREANVELL